MRFRDYLKDKGVEIILSLVLLTAAVWLMVVFKLNTAAVIIIAVLILITEAAKITYGYLRKRKFYNALAENVRRLDKAYLVLETLERPDFLEGKILCDILYEIDKSMIENVGLYIKSSREYAEYIEVWIHEVKLPLSAISLKLHNMLGSGDISPEMRDNIKRLQNETNRITEYVDQVLYYSRSENAEKDYHIQEVTIGSIVHDTVMELRETLLDNKIDLRIEINPEIRVNTDPKWLKFMIGQIISNSIKYRRENTDSYVKILSWEDEASVTLCIEDNGMGIYPEDIKRVFEKSFTGKNGTGRARSTGMGLYITKELSEKLGHNICVDSVQGEWTKVFITIRKDRFYEM
ncbi:MAG: sensor histidine kinase [Lachnospiraceae bacterium]|nr:sensor histidine kinase [Lachnospiraceae bacterium]